MDKNDARLLVSPAVWQTSHRLQQAWMTIPIRRGRGEDASEAGPHVRIVPGALLNQAAFESSECRKVHHSSLVLCPRFRPGRPKSRAKRERGAKNMPLTDPGAGGLGTSKDGLLRDRPAHVAGKLSASWRLCKLNSTRVSFRSPPPTWRMPARSRYRRRGHTRQYAAPCTLLGSAGIGLVEPKPAVSNIESVWERD